MEISGIWRHACKPLEFALDFLVSVFRDVGVAQLLLELRDFVLAFILAQRLLDRSLLLSQHELSLLLFHARTRLALNFFFYFDDGKFVVQRFVNKGD